MSAHEFPRHFEVKIIAGEGQDVPAIVEDLRHRVGRGFEYAGGSDGAHTILFSIGSYSDHPACVNALREAGLQHNGIRELETQDA